MSSLYGQYQELNAASIVTIHGLDTSSERTWSAHEEDGKPSSRLVNWLGDENMLPHLFPDARIFAYNWNANTFSDASTHYFHNHAEELLQKLENVRQVRNKNQYPGYLHFRLTRHLFLDSQRSPHHLCCIMLWWTDRSQGIITSRT